jgi:hypothetical protein
MPGCLDLVCHDAVQLCAAQGCHLRLAVPNTCPRPRSLLSALAQSLADPALREFVLAHDALGVDLEQYMDAVPGPLGYLVG